jgi:hypothetical protein
MMLGSYSYLQGNERRFSYTTTTDTKGRDKTHHFALMPLDEDLAVVRFFTDERFVEPKPVPPVALRRRPCAAHVSAEEECHIYAERSCHPLWPLNWHTHDGT